VFCPIGLWFAGVLRLLDFCVRGDVVRDVFTFAVWGRVGDCSQFALTPALSQGERGRFYARYNYFEKLR